MKQIKTSERESMKGFFDKLFIPSPASHKGQNGKLLIIGGSTLFHSASLWAAEIASHFVDMVHYSSITENTDVFARLKTVYRNGIIVHHKDILTYVEEDDCILIGPGMVRATNTEDTSPITNYDDILKIEEEGLFTREITRYLLKNYPEKKFVIDAGALQMMDPSWLKMVKTPPIITPHQLEFKALFDVDIESMPLEAKIQTVQTYAQKYSCIILLKAVLDIISDGVDTYVIEGGNAGLTKGGSGDILAGLSSALYTKNDALTSAIVASCAVKGAADELFKTQRTWFTMLELIPQIAAFFAKIIYNRT